MRVAIWSGGILAAVLAAIFLWPRRAERTPAVLLITLDTLRNDAVPAAGTPALDDFLKTATRFAGARTVVPLTVPSHASILSGQMPASHRLHDNSAALLPGSDVPLVAVELAEAGYKTAAFIAAPVLGRHTGLAAGFDTYDSPSGEAGAIGYIPADERIVAALAWLAEREEGQAWFCWVHLFDPHTPYRPYEGDARRPASEGVGAAAYDGEVRRADAAVEKLLAAVGPDVAVVIVSDHGEGLGEHDEPTHGPLCYATTIDAFLAVRAPGFAAGKVDRAPRSVCDVGATLRRLCGLPDRPGDGTPLMEPGPEAVVSESLQTWRIHGWGQCFSVSDGRYTLVESGATVELFDRQADPGETRPLAPEGHAAYERLDRTLNAYRARSSDGPEYQPDVLTPYGTGRRAESTYLTRQENAGLVDPRARLPWWARLNRYEQQSKVALARRDARGLQDAIAGLTGMSREEPDNPATWWALARAQGDLAFLTERRTLHADAARSARQAIDRDYLGSPVFNLLLTASMNADRKDLVLDALGLAARDDVVLDPRTVRLAVTAAAGLVERGEALAAAPARAILANALRHHGDNEEIAALAARFN